MTTYTLLLNGNDLDISIDVELEMEALILFLRPGVEVRAEPFTVPPDAPPKKRPAAKRTSKSGRRWE